MMNTIRISSSLLAMAVAMSFSASASAQIIEIDHKKVLGNGATGGNCASCHQKEAAAWEHTAHFRSLDKLRDGRVIADKLGITRTYRRTGMCIECHSTAKGDDPTDLSTISGVSCESCHGPSADWVKLHNDYGAGKTKDTEDAAHRTERHKKSDLAGMIRKDRVYLIAKNCFSCHLVPNEQIVNVGGHKTSSDFELVSWSHGEVKHNYFNSETNKDTTQQRKRILYVIGKLVDLEMSLHAAGKITEKGHYRAAILNRIRNAMTAIDEILAAQDIPQVSEMVKGFNRRADGSLILSEAVLVELPGKIGAVARAVAEEHDGSKLAAIDKLIPKPETYKGKTQP